MKKAYRIPRIITWIAPVFCAATLALAPVAQAFWDNQYWRGGAEDNWYSANWEGFPDHEWHEPGYLTNGFAYFGAGGFADHNDTVVAHSFVKAGSLNFSQQDWQLNFEAGVSATINVNWTSPVVNIVGNFHDTGLWRVDAGSQLIISGNVQAAGGLNKEGGGTAIINSTTLGSVIGGTNLYGGTLITDNPINNYNIRADTLLGFKVPTGPLRGDLDYNGSVYGAGNFVKKGDAKLTMTGDIYYTGFTSVEGGRLVLATFHNPYVTSSFTFNGGSLELSTRTSNQTYANPVNGTGSFTKSGPFNLNLTGPGNSAGGGVFVTGGSLIERAPMGQSYTLSNGSSLTFAPIGYSNHSISGSITGDGNFTMNGLGSVEFRGAATYTGGTTVTSGELVDYHPHGHYTVASEGWLGFPTGYGDLTYAGLITGSGNFYMSGSNTLTRTADYGNGASWTGTTTIVNGRLIELHPHGNYAMDADGTLEFANADTLFFGTGQSYGPQYRSVSGTISGTGDFTKSGAGDLVLNRAMTYVGRTTISAGALFTAVDGALPASTDLTVNAGSAFWMSDGLAQTIGSLSGGGSVVLPSSTLTIGGSSDAIFVGVISEPSSFTGSVVKNGTGTQTFTGQNTYTGDTLVSGGTLTLAGGGTLRIKVGANGTSNKLTGTGALRLDGTLVLDLTAAGNIPGNSWTLVNTSTLAETYGSTFALASTRGAFTKRASKWTRVENGVAYEFEPATGLLTVAPLTGYALWASLHAHNQTEDQDYNHDGVENGIAYFMNNTGIITLPGIVGGKITWPNGGTLAATAYGTEFKVQTSPDLASWADIPTGDANLTNLAASVAYTIPTGQGKRFVRLCVTPN